MRSRGKEVNYNIKKIFEKNFEISAMQLKTHVRQTYGSD